MRRPLRDGASVILKPTARHKPRALRDIENPRALTITPIKRPSPLINTSGCGKLFHKTRAAKAGITAKIRMRPRQRMPNSTEVANIPKALGGDALIYLIEWGRSTTWVATSKIAPSPNVMPQSPSASPPNGASAAAKIAEGMTTNP